MTAIGESDDIVGITSMGSAAISLTIPKLIQARSFSDLPLGTYTGVGVLNGNDDINIAINYGTTSRKYRVTATGSGVGGAFTVTEGRDTIAYSAYYNDEIGTSGRLAMSSGNTLTAQSGAVRPLSRSTLNANLSINTIEANVQAAKLGFYSGTITLVLAPE